MGTSRLTVTVRRGGSHADRCVNLLGACSGEPMRSTRNVPMEASGNKAGRRMRVDVSSSIRAVWLSPEVKQYRNRYLSHERSLARGSELADYRYACKYPHPTVYPCGCYHTGFITTSPGSPA